MHGQCLRKGMLAQTDLLQRGQATSRDGQIDGSPAFRASDSRIMRTHLVPHVIPPLLVYGTLLVATNIMIEVGVTFLNAGLKLPTASWGSMLADAPNFYLTRPLLLLWPGLALVLTTLAFNLLGDGLRDAFDPRSQR